MVEAYPACKWVQVDVHFVQCILLLWPLQHGPNFDTYQECQSVLFFFHKDHEKFECANFRICHIEFQHSSTIFLWMSIFLFPGVLANHWRARRLRLAKPGACAVRWLSVPNMRPGKSGIWLDSDGTNSYTYYMKYYCI